ncbi:MAG: 3-phosphoserine/phosphohydroxythreonine transaminase [Calditrichaeota bacterium]|nr:3-phosphoserine/phosphohydroxythreonine transaminase [Calditrichota bacterium]
MPPHQRVWNFNPGPAALPLEVLERINADWFNHRGSGMNVMEMSHRGKDYEAIHNQAVARVRQLLGVGEEYHVLFIQGGASLQFAMVPLNFLSEGRTADYLLQGDWSKKAIKEAKAIGKVNLAWEDPEGTYNHLPRRGDIKLTSGAAYFHYTSNETIRGTEFFEPPLQEGPPIVCDMSSDIFSHRLDGRQYALIYAGAQKNLGPSGVTLVVVADSFLKQARDGLPTMLSYRTYAGENSLYNTPPTFGIYVMSLVLDWIAMNGGLEGMEKRNRAKAELLYGAMDNSGDFYRGTVWKEYRSWMNVCFRMPSEGLEEEFLKEAKPKGFIGLKGHRSVGGIRVSLYNAVPVEAVGELVAFMKEFQSRKG